MKLQIERAVLVYQAGIANVFAVDCFNQRSFGRHQKRLLQADFHTCEMFARGLGMAGTRVCSMTCNEAGDISESYWRTSLEDAPFSDKFRPVFYGVETRDIVDA